MESQDFKVAGRGVRWKSVLIGLGLLSGSMIALVIALYLWSHFDGRGPAINWFLSVLIALTTIGLAGALAISRASFKATSLIIATGAIGTAVGFFWGPLGIISALLAANIVNSFVVAWQKRRVRES